MWSSISSLVSYGLVVQWTFWQHMHLRFTISPSWLFGSQHRNSNSKEDKTAEPGSFVSWCFEICCLRWLRKRQWAVLGGKPLKCQTNPHKRPRRGSNVFEMMESIPRVSETLVTPSLNWLVWWLLSVPKRHDGGEGHQRKTTKKYVFNSVSSRNGLTHIVVFIWLLINMFYSQK